MIREVPEDVVLTHVMEVVDDLINPAEGEREFQFAFVVWKVPSKGDEAKVVTMSTGITASQLAILLSSSLTGSEKVSLIQHPENKKSN